MRYILILGVLIHSFLSAGFYHTLVLDTSILCSMECFQSGPHIDDINSSNAIRSPVGLVQWRAAAKIVEPVYWWQGPYSSGSLFSWWLPLCTWTAGLWLNTKAFFRKYSLLFSFHTYGHHGALLLPVLRYHRFYKYPST